MYIYIYYILYIYVYIYYILYIYIYIYIYTLLSKRIETFGLQMSLVYEVLAYFEFKIHKDFKPYQVFVWKTVLNIFLVYIF